MYILKLTEVELGVLSEIVRKELDSVDNLFEDVFKKYGKTTAIYKKISKLMGTL